MSKKRDILYSLVGSYKDYPLEAYEFVLEGLDYTVTTLDKPRHISGRELLEGLKKFALKQFGPMTYTVLNNWKVKNCEDFGRIVFRLVEGSILKKSDNDSMHDFADGYDFEKTFAEPFKFNQK